MVSSEYPLADTDEVTIDGTIDDIIAEAEGEEVSWGDLF